MSVFAENNTSNPTNLVTACRPYKRLLTQSTTSSSHASIVNTTTEPVPSGTNGIFVIPGDGTLEFALFGQGTLGQTVMAQIQFFRVAPAVTGLTTLNQWIPMLGISVTGYLGDSMGGALFAAVIFTEDMCDQYDFIDGDALSNIISVTNATGATTAGCVQVPTRGCTLAQASVIVGTAESANMIYTTY